MLVKINKVGTSAILDSYIGHSKNANIVLIFF